MQHRFGMWSWILPVHKASPHAFHGTVGSKMNCRNKVEVNRRSQSGQAMVEFMLVVIVVFVVFVSMIQMSRNSLKVSRSH